MAAGGSIESMGMRIRDAVPGDAASLVEIASAVRLRASMDPEQQKQGFLIDISLEQYRYFIANDHVLAMEESDSRRLVGFSVILGPRTMAATGIREKAEHIGGATLNIRELDPESCAYWEQIAFLPRYAKGIYPVYLAFTSLRQAFLKYDNLFAAVVSRPIPNLAPRRLLDSVGWRSVGWIDQDYPAHGRVRYDVYYLNRSEFEKRLQEPSVRHLAERLGGDT
jgi:hypothetical protein